MTPFKCDRRPQRPTGPMAATDRAHGDAGRSVRAAPLLPSVGAGITVEFPSVVAPGHQSRPYAVVDVDGPDTITVRPLVGDPPGVRLGTPCLIHGATGAERLRREAMVLSSGPGGLLVQILVADEDRLPHCRRPMAAFVEVPGTDIGVIEGVTEDLSLRAVRVRVPIELAADRRTFVSLHDTDSTPIVVVARILACGPTLAEGSYFMRAEFTFVSPPDQLRLFALMDWSALGPRERVADHSPSGRNMFRLLSSRAGEPSTR